MTSFRLNAGRPASQPRSGSSVRKTETRPYHYKTANEYPDITLECGHVITSFGIILNTLGGMADAVLCEHCGDFRKPKKMKGPKKCPASGSVAQTLEIPPF